MTAPVDVRVWALIASDGTIGNVVLATSEFVHAVAADYADHVDVTDLTPRPGPGWVRDRDGTFTPPIDDAPPERAPVAVAVTDPGRLAVDRAALTAGAAAVNAATPLPQLRAAVAQALAAITTGP